VSAPLMEIACLLLPCLWAGLLVGVSFIATPAKFYAPSLSRAVALDVGRTTYARWNNVEWVLFGLVAFAIVLARPSVFALAAAGVLDILFLIQSMILLPSLNKRVSAVIKGGNLPAASDHLLYVTIDIAKLCILAAVAWKQGAHIIAALGQAAAG
jgi:hypothetical protein